MPATEYPSLATAKTVLSAVGSIAATAMVVRSVSHDLLPYEFQDYIFSGIRTFCSKFSNQFTLVVDEFDGMVCNEVYEAAKIYLGHKVGPSTRRAKVSRPEKEKHFKVMLERDEEIVDVYNGEKFQWVWICKKTDTKHFYNYRDHNSTMRSEVRYFELTFHKKNRDLVLNSYLPHITNEAEIKKQEKRALKIFTLDEEDGEMWIPVTLDHPATFDTLAMESDQKDMILKDLDQFLKRREYYRKIGKAWKRGYLLYGPPGTGKSSLIAAMANYLHFDVYDLELTEVKKNSELRRLLLATENKSILVVEDIDCTIDLKGKLANRAADDTDDSTEPDRRGKSGGTVTLSGLLNFVDGLWSSCGDERIIIFTTNHIEKLDPALLRPGRMDMHINLSYCSPAAFKILATNYLGIKDHVLFEEIEGSIQKAKVTPAEVAEQLLRNNDPDVALQGFIDFIREKIKENDKAEAGKLDASSYCEADGVVGREGDESWRSSLTTAASDSGLTPFSHSAIKTDSVWRSSPVSRMFDM